MKKKCKFIMITSTNLEVLEEIKINLPEWLEDFASAEVIETPDGDLFQMVLVKESK